ncbi:MAG TPA: M20/M25/M40 family metallo-hydrolase [Acidimicrobiales bacterium]|nr:M20/M25/M40 family metallo-hydrolase [Acidimicrobiales bacterium]
MTIGIDIDALIRFARDLASTPSVSGTEQAAVELTAAEFEKLGFDEVEIDAVGNCVGYIGTGSGPRLLIDGHIDSIPLHSAERWTVDPFGGVMADGRLYGLGICDQKGSIAAAAYGVAAAHSRGEVSGRIALVASVNEEDIEGAALSGVVDSFEPTWAITTEPSDTRLCIGQRGRAKLSVTVTGRSCHAGHAARGLNAAEALAELVVAMRGLDHPRHPRLGRREITCIDVASFPYPSVSTVPGYALARFDCRFVPGETPETLIQTIHAAAQKAWKSWDERPALDVSIVQAEFRTWRGGEFALPEFEQAWWTPEDSPLVTGVQAALGSVGLDATPRHYSFCTNGSYLSGTRSIPTIGFGVGEEHIAHQVDEYVTLDSLTSGARGFAAIAAELMATSTS